MSTLYVSDLDGTLLKSDETTSNYTKIIINHFIENGGYFTYATARSIFTASKVAKGIHTNIPVIVYNGSFLVDAINGDTLISNFFGKEVYDILDDLFKNDIYPIVYTFINDKEKFSYIPKLCTNGMKRFLDTRKGDVRINEVDNVEDLKKGNIFYLACIDSSDKLEPFYLKYKDKLHCVFQRDFYTNDPWLEILPLEASKSNAIKQLQNHLKCDELIVFGNGKNDIDMFKIADESYAVENACDELKKIATGIIESNDNDGVARWIEEKEKFAIDK